MKRIPLTKGLLAIVDDDDFDELSKHKWRITNKYAARSIYRVKTHTQVYMHREIMKTPKGMETDHINGDRLDNRRSNLRVCTCSENKCNRGPIKNNPTGFKGASQHRNRFRAQIAFLGVKRTVGLYDTAKAAHAAYCEASKILHGDYSRTL